MLAAPTKRGSLAAILSCATAAIAQTPASFDLVLRGGVVVDPIARTVTRGDVAIRDGRIAAIGEVVAPAGTAVLEVGGLHVAPGFIDGHTHVDVEITRDPLCQNFLRMGVTTILSGNCGRSAPDLDAHFARLEKGGVGVNYGSLVGHGTVRTAVLGTTNREPTADEVSRMSELVDQAMRVGAFGLSTGLIYVPGSYAKKDEIVALATVAGRHGGIYASHIRSENDAILDAIAEVLAIAEGAKLPVHVSHVKCTGKANHGRAAEVLTMLRSARAHGVALTADQYAYDASSTSIDVLFPTEQLDVGRAEFATRLRDDAEYRRTIHAALLAKMDQMGFGDFRRVRIASAKGNEDLNGMLLPDAAKKRSARDDRDAQAELAIDLLAAAAPSSVTAIFHTMAEVDVERFLAEDWIAIASDAGIRTDLDARPHPRGIGNNPRVLGHYVRERNVLDLPTAIHKMTALPAKIFGITDRGEMRVGAFADLVVFDPATVRDGATFDEPWRGPEGIRMVLVNGRVAVSQDRVTGMRAGTVLRHRGKASGG